MLNSVLYIFMRNDLDSMSPGKACAQASHVTNLFEVLAKKERFAGLEFAVDQWRKQSASMINGDSDFGTCIVLGGSSQQILETIRKYHNYGYLCGSINDPTYPLRDGKVTHLINIHTCSFVFAPNKFAAEVIKLNAGYDLY